MESLEDAARNAAIRWKGRTGAKDDIRRLALELVKTKTMTEVAEIIGVRRTSLYYFMYGRDGKNKSSTRKNDTGLSTHVDDRDLRESS